MSTPDAALRINPGRLTWAEVDPARNLFDEDGLFDLVRVIAIPMPPRPNPPTFAELDRWRAQVSQGLVDRYGQWACGWCWSIGEGGYDGGPVGSWCGAHHADPEQTIAAIAASLLEWRQWLETLAGTFDRFLPLPDGVNDPDGLRLSWELAVVQLVTATVDRTQGYSGWYRHCLQVLGWFLTAAGVPAHQHAGLLDGAVGGRFRSWAQPSTVVVTDIAERLARTVVRASNGLGTGSDPGGDWPDTWPQDWPAGRANRTPAQVLHPGRARFGHTRDDLRVWQAVRAKVDWVAVTRPVTGPIRGGRDAIAAHAAARGDGGTALSEALAMARQCAAAGERLTFERLAQWQRVVLGSDVVGFRSAPAMAKGGREYYGWWPGLPETFEACLAEATDPAVPLPSRAARVYLDVAFFHPFDDGNARAAMLALAYVLACDEVVLDHAAAVLRTVRWAFDEAGAVALARLIAVLIEGTRTRSAGG